MFPVYCVAYPQRAPCSNSLLLICLLIELVTSQAARIVLTLGIT